MRIGVLSKHRVVNYGSFLQAFALKKMLESLGHKVSFIDLKPGEGKNVNYVFDEPKWKRNLRRKIKKWDLSDPRQFFEARQDMFILDLFPKLSLSYYPSFDSRFDAVVIGSDEMFNCTEDGTFWGENLQMFGQGIDSPHIISYAASFGYTTLDRLNERHLTDKVGELLKHRFSALSVRDSNSAQIVQQLTGLTPLLHLDPVLIYDFSKYMPAKVNMSNYIAVYGYDNRLQEGEHIQALRQFARSTGKKLIGVGLWQDWCDENVLGDPFTVMAYIRDADYVFCETFHGAVFSIKYNKNFACFVRESNHNKLHYLLEHFGLTSRIVGESERTPEEIYAVAPEYAPVNELLSVEKQRTMEYFKKNLS